MSRLGRQAAEPSTSSERISDEFLSDVQLASLLHVTTRTTMRWRREGGGPPFIRCGAKRVLYSRNAVRSWLHNRTYPHHAAEATASSNHTV